MSVNERRVQTQREYLPHTSGFMASRLLGSVFWWRRFEDGLAAAAETAPPHLDETGEPDLHTDAADFFRIQVKCRT